MLMHDDNYALKFSALSGHYEIVKLLIANGANVQADNNYALQVAAEKGHYGNCQTINCQRSQCSS